MSVVAEFLRAACGAVKCSSCPTESAPGGWTYMTRVNPATGERAIVWRCPACNMTARQGLGIGAKPEALARARKRGSRNQRGTTRSER